MQNIYKVSKRHFNHTCRIVILVYSLKIFSHDKVVAHHQILFNIEKRSEFWIYLVEPGDEFFLHYDFWPDPIPSVFKHSVDALYLDISIKKQQETFQSQSGKYCRPKEQELYTGTKNLIKIIGLRNSY